MTATGAEGLRVLRRVSALWLDTSARHRGFAVVPWFDNPGLPSVTGRARPRTRVVLGG